MFIPEGLKSLPQWIVWAQIIRADGRLDKIPKQPRHPSSNYTDPSQWADYEDALKATERDDIAGLGFHFQPPLIGIDLDQVRDPLTGKLDRIGEMAVKRLASFNEVSPSSTGLHVIGFAPTFSFGDWNVKYFKDEAGKREVAFYTEGRFFTITGIPQNGRVDLRDFSAEVTDLYYDIEVLAKAWHEAEFPKAWEFGEVKSKKSDSERDFFVLCALARASGGNRQCMERLWRWSALWRDKVSKRDDKFIATTIDRVLAKVGAVGLSISEQLKLTEAGTALTLADTYQDMLRFCPDMNRWFIWQNTCWRQDRSGKIVSFAVDTVNKMMREEMEKTPDFEEKKKVLSFAKRAMKASALEGVVRLTKASGELQIGIDNLDASRWLLNFKNGTLNVQTGVLRPPARDDYITKQAQINFDPEATAPKFEQFLEEILPDKEIRLFVQKFAGYSMTGSIDEQCLAFLYGEGANGKSVLMALFRDVLGEYATEAAPDLLIAKRERDAASYSAIADIRGCRLVTTSESEEGKRMAEDLVKQITGESLLKSKQMRQDFFSFRNVSKLWLASNHKPQVVGRDHAIWRRIHLIPFVVTIPPEKQDKQLLAKLKREREGILQWMFKGYQLWAKEGLKPPKAVEVATDEYREETNPVRDWIDEKCILTPTEWSFRSDVRRSYVEFCDFRKIHPVNDIRFASALKEVGIIGTDKKRKDGRFERAWQGVKLRSSTKFTKVDETFFVSPD